MAGASALFGIFVAMGLAIAPASAQERSEPVRVGSFAGAYLAARIAETDNDLQSAIAYYNRALSFDPDNRGLKQSLMLALISTGQFDRALEHAESLRDVPEVARFSRLALAVDALQNEDYAEALDLLELPMQSDLDRLITGVATAWAIAGQGNGEAALEHLDELSGPDWYGVFISYHAGLIAEWAGMDEEAQAAYEATADNVAAGSAAPETFLRALEAQARFQQRSGDSEAALETVDLAGEFVAGRVQFDVLRERIENGEEVSALVGGVKEGVSEILLNLASALNRGGGESFVRLYLQYALALHPESDAVLLQLASAAEQQQDPELAIQFYERVPESSAVHRLARMQKGLNLADLDRHAEAEEMLKVILEEDPDDVRAYLALGGVYHSQENYEAGAELYERAVARIDEPRPEHWNIFYQRGIAYERLKQWERAEPNFKQALELYPDHPQVLNYLGYSWVDMNMNLEEGLDLIKRAVELRPSDGYIVDSLGWAYFRLERYEDAVRELERAVSLMPYDPILNDHLGDAYWRVGRRLEATYQWRHARDLEPEAELLEEIEEKLANGLPDKDEEDNQRADAGDADASEVLVAAVSPMERQTMEDSTQEPMGAEVASTPAMAGDDAFYDVRPGQSLWSISLDVFGVGDRYPELLDLNPELRGNPDRLVPGQRLRVPAAVD
ncbi:MAG: tetratricopeptide repeat protein [Rhizobiaceae bacterium]